MRERAERSVVAAIDALIDEQLSAGEPETGYDSYDDAFLCCRCGADWHGIASRRCPGTDSEGPVVRIPERYTSSPLTDLVPLFEGDHEVLIQQIADLFGIPREVLG